MEPAEAPPRIHVVHATSPVCHWSWGYEAAMNRLRLVYGDQIQLTLRLGCPYEDREQWLVDYGMSAAEAEAWVNEEIAGIMGVPIAPMRWEMQPRSAMPAVLAVQAARRQDEERAWRFHRELVRRFAVEGVDVTQESALLEAARASGLDATRLQRDLAATEALREEYEAQAQRGPPVHVGFYNVVLWDGGNRRVILDHAFDPRDLESAIDWMSGGALRKTPPTDVVGYLREHGLAPLSEIGRVFDFPDARAATEALEALEKAGAIERTMLARAPHWRAV